MLPDGFEFERAEMGNTVRLDVKTPRVVAMRYENNTSQILQKIVVETRTAAAVIALSAHFALKRRTEMNAGRRHGSATRAARACGPVREPNEYSLWDWRSRSC